MGCPQKRAGTVDIVLVGREVEEVVEVWLVGGEERSGGWNGHALATDR